MKNKLTKSNLIIAQRGVSLVVVFAVLVVSLLAVIPLSYGWFAKNNKVTASGMHTIAHYAKYKVTFTDTSGNTVDEGSLLEAIKAPGDSVEFYVTIENKGKYDFKLMGFGLESPTGDQEMPKYDSANQPHYLSTELKTMLTAFSVNGASETTVTGTPVFLRQNVSTAPGRIDYLDFLTDDIVLSANDGSVTFKIKIEFEDRVVINTETGKTEKVDQNIFKEFGKDGLPKNGACERKFFFTFEEILPNNQ